jgi:phytanoyl-CoA hydroxylase
MSPNNIKETFDNQGFVVLENLIEDNLINDAVAVFNDIEDYFSKNSYDPFNDFLMEHRTDQGALYDLYFRHPEYQKLTNHPKLIEGLKSIMGPDIFLYESALVYKPKDKKNEVPWHQDFMNRTDEPEKFIVWIALDDVTVDNGALKFIPGSHKNGFLPYHRVKGETHHTRLNLDGIDLENYKYGEMKKGDALIFHHLLLHSSDRISSDKPRRAYRFSLQGFEQIFSPRCVPVVLSGGGMATYAKATKKSTDKPSWKKMINKFGEKLASYS